ncbi:MarR family transcriptional regulator [Paenibacillus cellulosilyticus]|uniref:MarR family winged helix-turn-helix transcriptional regulator n=1 Tax=Paenibacillus cellulosilyticus TaxID=375489 RepID=UPI000D70B65C|nr:MarR family transcriptional regulator [Paenibacillus cellulosilyticus]QKS45910.1 MarR family transcriptional regulator [Paenibacillus cellulosilyticus]
MDKNNEPITVWLSLAQLYSSISDKLEQALQQEYGLSLKEFSVLYYISNCEEKKLRLQSLQEMVGLSQSATSRLVVRMEAKECGALHRHMCADDRRGIYTQITEIGESKFQQALETFNQVLQSELRREGLQDEFQSIIQKLF